MDHTVLNWICFRAQRAAQGQHQQSHSSGVVVQLQSKLASMSNNFKQVLEVRTENLKSQKSRAEQFSVGGVTTSLPQSVTQVNKSSFSDRICWISFIRPNPFSHTEVLLVGYILHWTLLNCSWSISEWIRSKSTYLFYQIKLIISVMIKVCRIDMLFITLHRLLKLTNLYQCFYI